MNLDEMKIAIDSLNLCESDWYGKYFNLIFTETDYKYYQKLAMIKYHLEKSNEKEYEEYLKLKNKFKNK